MRVWKGKGLSWGAKVNTCRDWLALNELQVCGLGVGGKELEGLHFSLWFVCLFGGLKWLFLVKLMFPSVLSKEQTFSAPLHYLLQGTVIEFFKRSSHQPQWLLLLSSRGQESWKHNRQSIILTLLLVVPVKQVPIKKQVLFNDVFTIITVILWHCKKIYLCTPNQRLNDAFSSRFCSSQL